MIQKLRVTLAIAAVIMIATGYNIKAGPCIGSALGAAVIRLIHK